MRGRILAILLGLASFLLLNRPAAAQGWAWGCSAPYNYEGSGYYLSQCASTTGYGTTGYVQGGWSWAPQTWVTRPTSYSPAWSWGAWSTPCYGWWGC